jgi:hypothetical protein
MISDRYSLDDAMAAMERAATGQDAKLLIYPQGLEERITA